MLARKDCEICKNHRARWLVEIRDNVSRKIFRAKVCGICKWKLWPSPRKIKDKEVIKVIDKIRGAKKPLLQPRIIGRRRKHQ